MKHEQLETILTAFVGAFDQLSDEQLHELTMSPYVEARQALLVPVAA